MVNFTTKALSDRLKQNKKELNNVKIQLLFYSVLSFLSFRRVPSVKELNANISKRRLIKERTLLEGALDNRKRAINYYQLFRCGYPSKKAFIEVAYLRYQAYKRELEKMYGRQR